MNGDTIARLLGGSLADPDGGPPLGVPTRSVVIAESLEGREAELAGALELGRRLAVVSDRTTHEVMGARVERALSAIASVDSLVLPGRARADTETVERIRAGSRRADALIAVGSGTVNDLCKYAGARDSKPYAVFATAPSMNGYGSATASISELGHKKSLPAQGAAGIFIDLTLFAEAPRRLIRAGLGDSLCRPTAQADWLLAHLLYGRPYREAPFLLLAEDEEALLAEPEALFSKDLAAMARLARTLILSGFGMALSGGSYPASQGEHLISHYADMMGDPARPESFHGEQIGVTTLTMARLQERLLSGNPPRLAPSGIEESDLIRHFGPELGPSCWREFSSKRLDAEGAEASNARIAERWDEIRERIAAVMRPPEALEAVLQKAGAPCRPDELHWPSAFYREAVRHAREIRDRVTFLDLAGDAGLFEAGAFEG